MPTLLIADDNPQIVQILNNYARKEGYRTLIAHDGYEVLDRFDETVSLVLLDVMMPKLDGFGVVRELRKTSNVPIIMVTARGEDHDKILGLDIGADDYIVKPFSPQEVMARIKAVLRRIEPLSGKRILNIANLSVDLEAYRVTLDSKPLLLTKKETELLYTLASAPDRVFSRDVLLDQVWDYSYTGDTRTVDAHMTRLRAKLDQVPHTGWTIRTIWGVGYKFELTEVHP